MKMNIEKRPELSIVMPIFNRKELVRCMIDSIIANTYEDWELLAIDDGSSDGVFEMLLEYAVADVRIKPYRRIEVPKGPQTCRNKGLELAEGDYIVFFDSDDVISNCCLADRINMIKMNPLVDFVVFPFGSLENHERGIDKMLGGFPRSGNDVDRFLARELPFLVCTNIYKTNVLREKQLFWDPNLLSLQDADFNLSVLMSGMKYIYAHTPIDYFVRLTNNGSSVSKKVVSREYFQSHIYAISKWYTIIHEQYGKSKDKELFKGMLWIYALVSRKSAGCDFAFELYDLVKKYDRKRSFYVKVMAHFQKVLTRYTFFSTRVIRKIVLFPYLVIRWIDVDIKK